jgi:hypothetical protein
MLAEKIRTDINDLIENFLEEFSEGSDIIIQYKKNDVTIYGSSILDNQYPNDINLFVKLNISDYTNEDSILEQLNDFIYNSYQKKYLDIPISLKFDFYDFEECDLGRGINLESLINENKIKKIAFDKLKLKQSTELNINNSEEARKAFSELANKQRGEPENKMREIQNLISGTYSWQLEHIGDLTHRISQRVYVNHDSIEDALNDIETKIQNGLFYLSSEYDLRNKHSKRIISDYIDVSHIYKSVEDYEKSINKESQLYSKYHAQLPVYNIVQYHARESAVHLGRQDYRRSRYHLEKLDDIIKNEEFVYKASQYNPNFEKELNINKKIKPKI